MYETSCQSRFDAGYWMLGAGALGENPHGRCSLREPMRRPRHLEMWALGSITMNKASGVDGILVELFQILKDDVKCQISK